MNITFTEEAMDRLKVKIGGSPKLLKLKYDTEGCGCVVSGVPALWLVNHQDEDDLMVETNYVPILVEKSKRVFLDENMTVGFAESANCFQLKCPSQILNPRMAFVEKREEDEF